MSTNISEEWNENGITKDSEINLQLITKGNK
jgi:hypothetical protein